MNILVFKLAALGDVVRTTSLLPALRERYPDARVTWVTSKAALPLVDGNPLVEKALVWPDAAAELARGSFDLVLSLEEEPGIAALIAASFPKAEVVGVVRKTTPSGAEGLGYTPSAALYYDMSLLNRDPDGSLGTANALKKMNRRTYIELWSKVLGLPTLDSEKVRPGVAVDASDRAVAKTLLTSLPGLKRPVIGLNPSAGSRWPAKRLSPRRAGALCRALAASFGSPTVLLGGPDEADYTAFALREAGTSAVDAGTKHTLRGFAAVIEACDAIVTADSLAFHLANAVGTPTAVFVGPTSPTELDLFGQSVLLGPAEECRDFYKSKCSLDVSCLDRIPDETFVRAVEKLLRGKKSA